MAALNIRSMDFGGSFAKADEDGDEEDAPAADVEGVEDSSNRDSLEGSGQICLSCRLSYKNGHNYDTFERNIDICQAFFFRQLSRNLLKTRTVTF